MTGLGLGLGLRGPDLGLGLDNIKINLYLYRRMLEDNEEDRIERIKTTCIILELLS